jgi:hypothetical protein
MLVKSLLALIFMGGQIAHGSYLFPCENFLNDPEGRRELIASAQLDYHEKFKINGWQSFSLDFGVEPEWIDPLHLLNNPVVYLGSGPDILRPIFNHPFAGEYMFIDSFKGWGEGPEYLSEEILTRMNHLGSFLEVSQIENETLSFKIRFKGSSKYQTIRFVRANYHNYQKMNEVFNSIGSDWAGVIVSAAPLPRRAVLLDVLKRIGPGGVFVHSRYSGISNPLRRKLFDSIAVVPVVGKSYLMDLARLIANPNSEGAELIISARGFQRIEHREFGFQLSTYAFFKDKKPESKSTKP